MESTFVGIDVPHLTKVQRCITLSLGGRVIVYVRIGKKVWNWEKTGFYGGAARLIR